MNKNVSNAIISKNNSKRIKCKTNQSILKPEKIKQNQEFINDENINSLEEMDTKTDKRNNFYFIQKEIQFFLNKDELVKYKKEKINIKEKSEHSNKNIKNQISKGKEINIQNKLYEEIIIEFYIKLLTLYINIILLIFGQPNIYIYHIQKVISLFSSLTKYFYSLFVHLLKEKVIKIRKGKKRNNLIEYSIYIVFRKEIIIYIIIKFLLKYSSSININKINILGSSKITLKINKTGNIKIYNYLTSNPSEAYITNEEGRFLINSIQREYDFNRYNNTIELIWNNNFGESCFEMFKECPDISEIDLSEFNSSGIKNMEDMFFNCSSLTSINLNGLDTSRVETMNQMFQGCSNLNSLDLSNFDTSSVTDMAHLFEDCSSLTSLDLTNFNTMNVILMSYMFKGCSGLNSLNISNFNTSKVSSMGFMFNDCKNLTSLDLSNFNTKSLICDTSTWYGIHYIFYGCSSLSYINLKNTNLLTSSWNNVFADTPDNLVVCTDERKWGIILAGISSVKELIINCTSGKINYTCYKKTEGNIENNNLCKICDDNNKISEYFNYTFISDSFVNCYNYYSEITCYNSCLTCSEKGNETLHNCIRCKPEFDLEMIFENNAINCYYKCPYFYYIDIISNKTYCTLNEICPQDYPKLIESKKECVKDCSKYPEYNSEKDKKCIISNIINLSQLPITTKITTNTVIIQYEEIKNNVIQNLNKTKILEGNDITIKIKKNIDLIMTSTENQKNDKFNNKSTINLGNCELILKMKYNIPLNDSLYILIWEIIIPGMKIPRIEYELYYPLNSSSEKLIQLDLEKCQNEKIYISVPVNLEDDNIDKYNKSSSYYNDICTKTDSDNKIDISLNDRKNEFIENNMTLCEEDCDLVGYNYTTKKVECKCLIKISIPLLLEDIKFDKDKLLKSFININNICNINIIKCYRNLLNFNTLKKNYGFFIQMIIIFLFLILLFVFCLKSYKKLIEKINIIKNTKNKVNNNSKTILNTDNNKITKNTKKRFLFKKKINNNTKNNIKNKVKTKKGIQQPELKLDNKKKYNKNSLFNKIKKNKNSYKNNFMNNNLGNINIKNDLLSLNNNNKKKANNKNKNLKNDNNINKFDILKYNDNELNSLDYRKALLHDKRTYFQYYISLLKINNLLLFSFYSNNNDYNAQSIKIFLFFFFFNVHFTINTLFFNDTTMHKIYIDKGNYNFVYQIPQIIYASLISGTINALIKFLGLSEKNILEFKNNKTFTDTDSKKLKITLKIKFILFYIISFILLIFFSFYISCFCSVYINTQIHLIKDTFISFGLSLIYPFGFAIIPGIFRISSLKDRNKNKSYYYKFSQFISSILL